MHYVDAGVGVFIRPARLPWADLVQDRLSRSPWGDSCGRWPLGSHS